MTPQIVERPAQPYAAVKRRIRMDNLSTSVDAIARDLFGWLDARGIAITGPPFFKYNNFNDTGMMDVEWGAPVPADVTGDGMVLTAILPAGKYATVTHIGLFTALRQVTADLLNWIATNGLLIDERRSVHDHSFGCRLEIYHTDPRVETDSRKWRTEITIHLAA